MHLNWGDNMSNNIVKYQNAFNSLIQTLKKNPKILAVTAFGSMVTGDLWKDSDIDLFVIIDDDFKGLENVFGEEKEISVHIKLLSKEEFLKFHEVNLRGGTLHRKFLSSRLIFSNDSEITDRYNSFKYYPEVDRERWNLVYLSSVIKSISACKKYLYNNSIYGAYPLAIAAVDDYSKLYLNYSGYMINKGAISMAVNLDDNFKEMVDKIFTSKDSIEESINKVIEYIEDFIDSNIKGCCNILLEYLKNENTYISSRELEKNSFFKEFSIDMEDILIELSKRNFTEKSGKEYISSNGKNIIRENVYKLQ